MDYTFGIYNRCGFGLYPGNDGGFVVAKLHWLAYAQDRKLILLDLGIF
jgi:hypothetical protein